MSPPSPLTSDALVCRFCGARQLPDATYCSACGQRLKTHVVSSNLRGFKKNSVPLVHSRVISA